MSGVKVVFAHDTEVALAAAAALVNTLDGDQDDLTTVADLDAYATTWGLTGVRRRDKRELDAVRALRGELRRLWESDRDTVVNLVNAMLLDAHALPQLVRHDEWDYHLHATPPDAPLATRMAVEAAMAFVDVVRSDELDRLTICAAADCENVTVDLTKNRSKRYCEDGCGNRAAVAAYRARKAAANQR
jgi:predicted RNA-binding Zn ribbon-like protein